MRSLSQIITLICLIAIPLFAQSPHGDKFELDCSLCHQSSSWKVDLKKVKFDHSTTSFDLVGQHQSADCKSCHQTLKFADKINEDCISCHTDIHKGTVGEDCAKCHTPDSWIVKDINGLHQDSGFPLLGRHRTADCEQCHSGYNDLNFEPGDQLDTRQSIVMTAMQLITILQQIQITQQPDFQQAVMIAIV